jgi:hypothetical protein
MLKSKTVLTMAIVFFATAANAAILVDESDEAHQDRSTSRITQSPDQGLTNRTVLRSDETFADVASFKHRKKMGISATLAGATGLVGTNLDLNIFEDFAISIGGGVSRGFGCYNAHVKQTLGGGENFQPYFAMGYSRWFSNGGGPIDQTSPSFVANKFLSDNAKATGKFAENIIYPALGLQYVNINGDLRGLGFFGEALVLMDLNNLAVAPTLGIGSILYF